MQSESQRNTSFMITKEVFINHMSIDINLHYNLNPQCLGQGGFGKVFQGIKKQNHNGLGNQDLLGLSFSSAETSSQQNGYERSVNQRRAIKQINFKKLSDKQLMENQIQILSYLDHPSIVKLYETYEYKKQLYLVLDLLTGGDLFTVIEEGKQINESRIKIIFQQIIKALNYLHSQNICHRDIKLENILFLNKNSDSIKLIDFGLAYCWEEDLKKQLKKAGLNKKLVGTPDYMSPQMIIHNYDQRCDIWSAGIILYMLLSGGISPFSADNDQLIKQKVINLDYSLNIPEFKNISSSAKDLISKILVYEDQRLSMANILNHQWFTENISSSIKCVQDTETVSTISSNQSKKKIPEVFRKFKPTKSFEKTSRKCSEHTFQASEFQFSSIFSDDSAQDLKIEKLTIEKLEYYSSLSMLQKFQAIYSVSKLSQVRTNQYELDFKFVDKNNDGTISLQDLTEYLFITEKFCDKQKTEFYFNQLSLSKRNFISYSQFLACIICYESKFKEEFNNSQEFQLAQKFSCNGKLSQIRFLDTVDLFDQCFVHELFCFLDKDNNDLISLKDFIKLLQSNGIARENKHFVEQLNIKISEIGFNLINADLVSQEVYEWQQDPRKFKQLLSRTYKGEKDGGICIDFSSFKHLMRSY